MQTFSISVRIAAAGFLLATSAFGATSGKVVPIDGTSSDIALDERRGQLYIANFPDSSIEVMSTASNSLVSTIGVAMQPAALALSPDNRYLAVAHYQQGTPPGTQGVSTGAVTIIDMDANQRRTIALDAGVLAVAFGADDLCLVLTEKSVQLLDPVTGTLTSLTTYQVLAALALPVPLATFPAQIIKASASASGDHKVIYGYAASTVGSNAYLAFSYIVAQKTFYSAIVTASPPLGPQSASVNQDGTLFMEGWSLSTPQFGVLAQIPNVTGALNIGTTAFDPTRAVVYVQAQTGSSSSSSSSSPSPSAAPVLWVMDNDNLNIRDTLQLPENLSGRSIVSSDGSTLYAVSVSGATVLPLNLKDQPHIVASVEDLVFRGNFCARDTLVQEFDLSDPSGHNVDFSLSTGLSGVTIQPSSGVTPAHIRILIDPNTYANQKGTASGSLTISSNAAVNVTIPVRLLINSRQPDQQGDLVDVPGTLVDLVADPVRNRFYILRQDKNQVLVFNSDGTIPVAILRTGNTPTQMAMTTDHKYLLVGADNSQILSVFDLDLLRPVAPIGMPGGHYPRSIAASNAGILAFARVAGTPAPPLPAGHNIDSVDFANRIVTVLPSLGIYKNTLNISTVLVASPNASWILGASADGNVIVYSVPAGGTFVASRKDFNALGGPYAASVFDQFLVSNHVLDSALVPINDFETDSGAPSGFAYFTEQAFRTTAGAAGAPGTIERVLNGKVVRPTRMTESPLTSSSSDFPFMRTLAVLSDNQTIISLTVSGFTRLSTNYDAASTPSTISSVVNAADQKPGIAPGGLVIVNGTNFSGPACLTVGGVFAPVLLASASSLTAQLPFTVTGPANMVLYSASGTSNGFPLTILTAAPAIFRTGTAGDLTGLATVFRADDNQLVTSTNPVHQNSRLTMYLTGMGQTNPQIAAGVPAPNSPNATLSRVTTTPQITLGGAALTVEFAGLAPGMIGVYQVNVFVPSNVPLGDAVPLTITQGGYSTSVNLRVIK